MSQTPLNTLCFTTEQGNNIIVKDSLFSRDTEPMAVNAVSYNDLKKLLEKDKKLELHAITLSDYWRREMIPRGLRINKFPSFGKDSPEFKQKWEAILNKCSMDLMLLLIENAKAQRAEIQSQLAEVKPIVFSNVANEEADELEKKLRDNINELSQTLTRYKLDKFKRDQQDYEDETVYVWHKHARLPRRRARSVSFNLTSSATTSEEDEPPQHTRDHFLGFRRDSNEQNERRGGGGRGENREYKLRPRITRRTTTKRRQFQTKVDLHRFYRNLHLKAWYHSHPAPVASTSTTQDSQKDTLQSYSGRKRSD